MRKLLLYIASSIDQYIATKDHSVQWLEDLAKGHGSDHGYEEFYNNIDTVLMGRKTYDIVLGFDVPWPYNRCQTYVFSRQANKQADTEKTEFVEQDPIQFIRELKNSKGQSIWLVGGGELISTCLASGLVDEMIISIAPIMLGEGLPLFPGKTRQQRWNLQQVRSFAGEFVQLHYQLKSNDQ